MNITQEAIEKAARQGWNQTEFQQRCGFHGGRMSRWASGKGQPKRDQIATMALTLGLSMEELTGLPTPPDSADLATLVDLVRAHGIEKCLRWITTGATALADGDKVEVHVSGPRRRAKGAG